MLPLDRVSASKISTFDTCKYKYWLTYFRPDIELKSNFGAENGTLIHNVLDRYSVDHSYDYKRALMDGYAGKFEGVNREGEKEVFSSPLLLAKADDFANQPRFCLKCEHFSENKCVIYDQDVDKFSGCPKPLFDKNIKMVETAIAKYTPRRWRDILCKDGVKIGAEYRINITFPGSDIKFIGFFDLVSIQDEKIVHIFDYKAGKKAKSLNECLKDWQVLLYCLAAHLEFVEDINNKGYKYEKVIIHFDYFQGKEHSFEFTAEQRNKIYEDLKSKKTEFVNLNRITRIATKDNYPWQCKSLCDIAVCESTWTGAFDV